MEDKIVDLINYKEKKGNHNVDLYLNSGKATLEEIENILKVNRLFLKDSQFDLENYPHNREISVTEENSGGGKMSNNEYVTEKELKALEDRLEQKMNFNQEILTQKMDATKKEIDLKFDNQLLEFKDLLNTKFNDQKKEQDNNKKWIISTVIATAALLFTFLKIFL